MTPQDALQILDQVGANFTGNRQDHANIQMAIQTLNMYISVHEEADKAQATKSDEIETPPSEKTPTEPTDVTSSARPTRSSSRS